MTTASAKPETATAAAPQACECFGDSGLCGSTHRPNLSGPDCCDLCGLPVKAGSSDGLKHVNEEPTMADFGDVQGAVPTTEDVDGLGAPYASLARAEWFVIVARGSLAFRYGPYDGPTVGQIMSRCQDERIACLVTANCGPEFDWDLARDFAQKIADPAPAQPEGGA